MEVLPSTPFRLTNCKVSGSTYRGANLNTAGVLNVTGCSGEVMLKDVALHTHTHTHTHTGIQTNQPFGSAVGKTVLHSLPGILGREFR